MGQPAALLFTPEDVDRGEHIKEMETARREGRAEDERCHIRKDGTRFWSSGVVTLVRDDAGIPRGYAKVMRDITERKQMEEELRATLSEKDVLIKYQPAELTVRAHCGPEGEGEFGADQEPGARHCHHP